MEGWLKTLIATACVVVIAGGGYFGWSEWQRSKERKKAEHRSAIAYCKAMIRDLSRNETKDYKGFHITGCINQSYVTEEDFQKGGASVYLEQFKDMIKPVAEREKR